MASHMFPSTLTPCHNHLARSLGIARERLRGPDVAINAGFLHGAAVLIHLCAAPLNDLLAQIDGAGGSAQGSEVYCNGTIRIRISDHLRARRLSGAILCARPGRRAS
jgi:hypothetical protein